jgi:hypothetical protein
MKNAANENFFIDMTVILILPFIMKKTVNISMPIDVISFVRVQSCLNYKISFILFCSIKHNRMHTNIKGRVRQAWETSGKGRIRINIVSKGIDMNISPLIRSVYSTNEIACCNIYVYIYIY